MMRGLGRFLALSGALAIATVLAGWWCVPIVAAAEAWWMPRRGAALRAASAATLAWGGILWWSARSGAVLDVDRTLAQIVDVPRGSMLVMTLAWGALLAGSAAMLVASYRRGPKREVHGANQA